MHSAHGALYHVYDNLGHPSPEQLPYVAGDSGNLQVTVKIDWTFRASKSGLKSSEMQAWTGTSCFSWHQSRSLRDIVGLER